MNLIKFNLASNKKIFFFYLTMTRLDYARLIILLTDNIIKSVVTTDPEVSDCLSFVPILNGQTLLNVTILKWNYNDLLQNKISHKI